jgi:hypothetical protein
MSGDGSVSAGGANAQVLDHSVLGTIGTSSAASPKNPSGVAFSPNGTLPDVAAQVPTTDASAKRFQQAIQHLDNEQQINLLTRTLATRDFSAAFGDAVTNLLLSPDFTTLDSYNKTALLTHLQNHPGTLLDHPKPGREDFAIMLSAGRDELDEQRGIARLSPEERQTYEQTVKLSCITPEGLQIKLKSDLPFRAIYDKVHSPALRALELSDPQHPPDATLTSLSHFGPPLSPQQQRFATQLEELRHGRGPDTTMMGPGSYVTYVTGGDPQLGEMFDSVLFSGGGPVAPFNNTGAYAPEIGNDPFYPSAHAEPAPHIEPMPTPDAEAPIAKAEPAAAKPPANTNSLDPSYKLNAPVQLQSKETPPIPTTREWRSHWPTQSTAPVSPELTEPSSSTPHGPQSYADDADAPTLTRPRSGSPDATDEAPPRPTENSPTKPVDPDAQLAAGPGAGGGGGGPTNRSISPDLRIVRTAQEALHRITGELSDPSLTTEQRSALQKEMAGTRSLLQNQIGPPRSARELTRLRTDMLEAWNTVMGRTSGAMLRKGLLDFDGKTNDAFDKYYWAIQAGGDNVGIQQYADLANLAYKGYSPPTSQRPFFPTERPHFTERLQKLATDAVDNWKSVPEAERNNKQSSAFRVAYGSVTDFYNKVQSGGTDVPREYQDLVDAFIRAGYSPPRPKMP